jgi:hypothetical protein
MASGYLKMGDLAPHLHGGCSQFAMVGGWNVVAGNWEKVGDWGRGWRRNAEAVALI